MSEARDASTTIRVMLVDDQGLLRESFKRLLELEGEGIEVVGAAGDGEEALALIERLASQGRAPQVVLMDIRMPRLDGIGATREIAKRFPDVGVMMLTTFDDDTLILDGVRAGAKGYMLKDVTSEELVRAIRAVARGESPLQPSVAAKLIARLNRLPEAEQARQLSEQAASPSGAGQASPSVGPRAANGWPVDELTEREREILRYLAHGDNNREIGETLFITEGTVKNHVSNILSKLALRDRTQAALWAREHGFA
jgi:DNA-binding NarL/FixJ family response regulator